MESNDLRNDSINKHVLGKRMAIKSKLGEVDGDFGSEPAKYMTLRGK